jgi:hypothetical protein
VEEHHHHGLGPRCGPDCGKEQVMTFDRFGWPGQVNLEGHTEADPKAIRRNRSAWYQCEHCTSRWNDYKRDKAVLAAMKTGWQPVKFTSC